MCFLLAAEAVLSDMLDQLLAAAGQQGGANGADGNGANGSSSSRAEDASAAEVARQEGLVSGATYLLQSQAFYRCRHVLSFFGLRSHMLCLGLKKSDMPEQLARCMSLPQHAWQP